MLLGLTLVTALAATDAGIPEEPPTFPMLPKMAKAMEPQVNAPWVKSWLREVKSLPSVKPTTWFCTKDQQRCEPTRPDGGADWLERAVDDEYVYARITDPIAYARPFEILAKNGFNPTGKKVLDFGYGNLGQLVMLARLGVDVHGIEIDALLPLATKAVTGKQGKGNVTLHHGFFASDQKLVSEVGGGYALWMSKNTLKRGYVHPAEPKDAKAQLDLGLDDAALLKLIHSQLALGGYFFIYNIAPAQAEPYKPMADGRCPFTKEALTAAGFEVIAFDVDDSKAVRDMARALEWAAPGEDLEKTLFATFTLARRAAK